MVLNTKLYLKEVIYVNCIFGFIGNRLRGGCNKVRYRCGNCWNNNFIELVWYQKRELTLPLFSQSKQTS